MIEAKISLLIFVWSWGQAEDKSRWMNDAYLTLESCEEDATKLKAMMAREFGSDNRIEHHCIHANDRLDP